MFWSKVQHIRRRSWDYERIIMLMSLNRGIYIGRILLVFECESTKLRRHAGHDDDRGKRVVNSEEEKRELLGRSNRCIYIYNETDWILIENPLN